MGKGVGARRACAARSLSVWCLRGWLGTVACRVRSALCPGLRGGSALAPLALLAPPGLVGLWSPMGLGGLGTRCTSEPGPLLGLYSVSLSCLRLGWYLRVVRQRQGGGVLLYGSDEQKNRRWKEIMRVATAHILGLQI